MTGEKYTWPCLLCDRTPAPGRAYCPTCAARLHTAGEREASLMRRMGAAERARRFAAEQETSPHAVRREGYMLAGCAALAAALLVLLAQGGVP